ncbi:hypothetical protein ABS768_14935 [Flavobacterium sp. ST-75]|uniref:Uncharacterized protein n=1 Tax=Flavobacterium rhizophilum TaxID=3163296 RepID=A0ABW8YI05_9FLAO
MKENFKIILAAFEEAGMEMGQAQFSITEYSLKTRLSFKFEHLHEFLDFLQIEPSYNDEKSDHIKNILIEEGINPDNFFYVNFYKTKVTEL